MTLTDWLSELERVEKAATKGPWTRNRTYQHTDPICRFGGGLWAIYPPLDSEVSDSKDSALIAQSRNALPKLLAIVRVQQEALKFYSTRLQDGLELDSQGNLQRVNREMAAKALAEMEKIVGGG